MGFPTIRASNSGLTATSVDESVTIVLPAGHSAGDLLIIGLVLDGDRVITNPTGWTLLANPSEHITVRHAVWYKTREEGIEVDPVIEWVGVEGGTWYSIAITSETWSGTPEIAYSFSVSNTISAPNLEPTWGETDTLWLALHGWDDARRTSSTDPENYTLITYQDSELAGYAGHRTHYRQVNAASQNPTSITISVSEEWYAYTIAIQPASTPQGIVLVAPADTTSTPMQPVTLEWQAYTGAVNYEYQVASDNLYATIVQTGTTASTSKQLDMLNPGTYYWRIRAQVAE